MEELNIESGFEEELPKPLVVPKVDEPRPKPKRSYQPRELYGERDGRGGRHNLPPEVRAELQRRKLEAKQARSERLREKGLITRGRGAAGTGRPRKARRHAARIALLPSNRICPSCGKVTLESRKWVIAPNNVLMCLSCWRLRKKLAKEG